MNTIARPGRHAVGPLLQGIATAWARVRVPRRPALDSTLKHLGQVQRRLASRDVKLSERQRRHCLEMLQSAAVELDVELAKAAEASARLETLAARQLERARDLLSSVSPLRTFACLRARADPVSWGSLGAVLFAGVLTAGALLAPSSFERLTTGSLLQAWAVASVLWALVLPSSLLRLVFDGERLLVRRSLGWLTLGAPKLINLSHVDEVRVVRRGKVCTLSLMLADGEHVLGEGEAMDEAQLAQLLQWCTEARLGGGRPPRVVQVLDGADVHASSGAADVVISVLSPVLRLGAFLCAAALNFSSTWASTKGLLAFLTTSVATKDLLEPFRKGRMKVGADGLSAEEVRHDPLEPGHRGWTSADG